MRAPINTIAYVNRERQPFASACFRSANSVMGSNEMHSIGNGASVIDENCS